MSCLNNLAYALQLIIYHIGYLVLGEERDPSVELRLIASDRDFIHHFLEHIMYDYNLVKFEE